MVDVLLLTVMATVNYSGFQTNDHYDEACHKTQDALFAKTGLKTTIEDYGTEISRRYPEVSLVAGTAYVAGVKKELRISTKKFTPFFGAKTFYQYNYKDKTASINVIFPFN